MTGDGAAWERTQMGSGAPWEPIAGYSRVVRVGPHVFVAGTTATDPDGHVVGVGDHEMQTRQTIQNIERALESVGARLTDVVRTRIYVVDILRWEAVARVHGEVFGDIRPVTAMVQVSRLIAPEMLVEIEADAILTPQTEE
jgi:enamine deaminase RidA (YjgF/YER057c/UK114 family)